MIHIRFEQEKNRAAAYDNGTEVGECVFSPSGGAWISTHTYVAPSLGGMGIAAKLVDEVVRRADSSGIRIIPRCSYAKRHLQKN